jgi:hypothetical protein
MEEAIGYDAIAGLKQTIKTIIYLEKQLSHLRHAHIKHDLAIEDAIEIVEFHLAHEYREYLKKKLCCEINCISVESLNDLLQEWVV